MIRKKNGKGLLLLLVAWALLMTGSTGCSKQAADTKQKVEGLDKLGQIKVISREEGSGTRGTFAQLAGFVQENSDKDQTVKDAQIADDTASVLNMVGSDQAAIGYGSAGIMVSDSQVKVLSVGGVEPGQNNAGYPLSRSFYLVWSGKLNDVEDDFMRYIRGAGQEIVSQSYTAVGKQSSFLSLKPKGKITVTGSTSVGPLLECLAEEYMKLNPKAVITVKQTDSSDGIRQAMQGKCDLGMSSRELKDNEKEILDYESIARDEIAVIVNKENPLKDISLEQLEKIYTGKITEWQKLYD